MSGVAKGVRVMATSTPACQQDNPPILACGCAVLTVLQLGGVDGALLCLKLLICWLKAVDAPAASVIDSKTGGTLLTNGMPGTCMHEHRMLQAAVGAVGVSTSAHLRAAACSSGLRAFGRRSTHYTTKHKVWCVHAALSLIGGQPHAPVPGRGRAPCQPGRSASNGRGFRYNTCPLQLDVASHLIVRGMACDAADGQLGAMCRCSLMVQIYVWVVRSMGCHPAGWEQRAGKMKPPLKPARTVMEMATSLAKATATRILCQIQTAQ